MGILGYKDCGLVKIGEFKNDKIENTLVVFFLNNGKNLLDIFQENMGEELEIYKNNIIEQYIGNINNNKKGEGYGIYYYYNREIYVGYWEDNFKKGYGIYLFDNGDIYVGEWKDNNKEGYGFNCSNNGDIYIGQWKDNDKEGYVHRHFKIRIKAFDALQNKDVELVARGYDAIVLQHEYDHLNGLFYYDRINPQAPKEALPNEEII